VPARDELITLAEAARLTDMGMETLRSQSRRAREDGSPILRTITVGKTRLTTLEWLEDYKNYIAGRSPRSRPLPDDWESRAAGERPDRPRISLGGTNGDGHAANPPRDSDPTAEA
jgi:hypothetical protein